MPIDIDSALGIHPQALSLRSRRAELLSANLANADTPNYKARDIDFRSALAAAVEHKTDPSILATTHSSHLTAQDGAVGLDYLMYRQPLQASVDGNTVDTQREHAEFAENAMRYQASLTFLGGKIRTLLTAIRGE